MSKKIGRPIKVETFQKKCTICKDIKTIENFRLEPTPGNPLLRRNQCIDCKNKQTRERLIKQNAHQNRYWAMSDKKRAEYIKKKSKQNQHRFKTNPQALANKKAYEKTDKGIYNRYINECKRRNRIVRGIKMDLNLAQFSVLINKPCHYCGIENARGVDRIDSNGNYTPENSLPCCRYCNWMKSDKTTEEFLTHIKKIANHKGL